MKPAKMALVLFLGLVPAAVAQPEFMAVPAFFDLNKLVHLLLVLGQRETDFGVVEDIGHLIGD